MTHIDDNINAYHEDSKATHARKIKQRDAIIHTLLENETINPFTVTKTKELVNIDTSLRATEHISSDLLELENKRNVAIQKYVESNTFFNVN